MHAITRNTYMHKIRNNIKTKGSSVRLSFLSSTKNLNNHLTSKFPEINKTDKKKNQKIHLPIAESTDNILLQRHPGGLAVVKILKGDIEVVRDILAPSRS